MSNITPAKRGMASAATLLGTMEIPRMLAKDVRPK